MSTSALSIDVYVSPMRPYNCPDQLGEGEVATWAPSSSSLISGPTEGILIDALLTFNNADEIAAWAKGFGKKITGIYITHGHSDHWLGLAGLLEHFPKARGYAAPEVAGRAAWEAEFNETTKYWTSRFPGELPETPVVPEALETDEILVDGQVVNVIHVGQGDVEGSTAFHVPSAEAVVTGDVVYNNVHMMMYEADEARREAWSASIRAIAALNPKIVVAGHKSVGVSDLPENLAASQQYLRDFTAVANRAGSVEELVHGMLDLHGERDQPHALDLSPSGSRSPGVNDLDGAVSPDGLPIRPLTPADRASLAKMPGHVPPQSAIRRFHGALNRLTDPLLDRLLDLEPGRQEALVAADELGIAGAARFIRDEDASSTAEVAIIIADDWQHQGVARLMLDWLKLR